MIISSMKCSIWDRKWVLRETIKASTGPWMITLGNTVVALLIEGVLKSMDLLIAWFRWKTPQLITKRSCMSRALPEMLSLTIISWHTFPHLVSHMWSSLIVANCIMVLLIVTQKSSMIRSSTKTFLKLELKILTTAKMSLKFQQRWLSDLTWKLWKKSVAK